MIQWLTNSNSHNLLPHHSRSNAFLQLTAIRHPVAGRGRPRKRHVPDQLSITAEDVLGSAKWRRLTGFKGTKGPLPPSACASPTVRRNASATKECSTCPARKPGSSANNPLILEREGGHVISNAPYIRQQFRAFLEEMREGKKAHMLAR
jgi:hypothetical protein